MIISNNGRVGVRPLSRYIAEEQDAAEEISDIHEICDKYRYYN
jgi:hypothetical protein